MASLGPGVCELRIRTRVEHRVIYLARFSEGVYVLHAFAKKTQRTPKNDIELAKRRLGDLLRDREKQLKED